MSFDNSRFTFNPWNDYFGVVMQQGRVQLDSDWNEWLAEFARRIQAGTLDILGLAGVPSTTPDAFKIRVHQDRIIRSLDIPPGASPLSLRHITIGPGRIYVDGLLVENHGPVASAQWDAALAEWSGSPQTPGAVELDIDYTEQPYYPGAALPSGNGPFLVYLDVWQRDVNYLEDPNLVDQAVGVDTTGRIQTVWQVKMLPVSGGVACSTPDALIAPWESLILPSPSLLTTGLVPSASSGPCALSPATGYTGLENQSYRVQIHQGGPAGTATFKWSRENGSVSTAVTAIASVTNSMNVTASQLTVQSMGRDQVLGFNPGDWVEVTDDYRELNGQAGGLHQIDSIDSTAKTITLDSAVLAANFPVNSAGQTNPSRHTRILRWDQAGVVYESDDATVWVDLDAPAGPQSLVGNTGIPVPPSGTALILENGITVAFDLAQSQPAAWNPDATYTPGQVVASHGVFYTCVAGNTGQAPPNTAFWSPNVFQTGDFWAFAARTADGSVQTITQPAAAQSQLATAWDPATSYSRGQIVTSGGNYYICAATSIGQPPPNPSWSAVPAPPLGTRHHYCRLGIVDFTATPPVVSDCRQLFPPLANPGLHVTGVTLGNGTTLPNDTSVGIQDLGTGINVICDGPLDSAIITQPSAQNQSPSWNSSTGYTPGQAVTAGDGNYYICLVANTGQAPPNPAFWAPAQFNCPFCFVTVDLPVPAAPSAGWFNPVVLPATVSVASTQINWFPAPSAVPALTNLFLKTGPPLPPLLAHLTLRGNCIWAQDNPEVYLNGAAVGAPGTQGLPPATGLQLPSGDGRRYADFEMWFWITPPGVTLSTGELDFAPTIVGASSTLAVTLTNNGASPLSINGIAVSGLNAGDFSQTNLCGTEVASGASCTINVTFTPTAVGARTGQIAIAKVAGDTSPYLIALTGAGIQPQVSASPASLTFPAQTVGATSAPQTVMLTNIGSAPLTVSSISIAGMSLDFTQTSTCLSSAGSGTLAPGQQCAISVQFKPTVTGPRLANLSITHNAPGSPLVIPLSGTGNAKTSDKTIADKLRDKIIADKISDKTLADVKVTDVVKTADKTHADVKVTDVVKTADKTHADVKVTEVFRPESPADVPAEDLAGTGDEGATRKAFIGPGERPPVGSSLGEPDDEPTQEGPKDE